MYSSGRSSDVLEVITKDFEKFRFFLNAQDTVKQIHTELQVSMETLRDNEMCYAFVHRIIAENTYCPWINVHTASIVDPRHLSSHLFRITSLNKDFKHCPTYDSLLAVPAHINDSELIEFINSFELQRFPVISLINSSTKSVLLRCSKPIFRSFDATGFSDIDCFTSFLFPTNNKILLVDLSGSNGKDANQQTFTLPYGAGYVVDRHYLHNHRSLSRIKISLSKFLNEINLCPSVLTAEQASEISSYEWCDAILSLIQAGSYISQQLAQEHVTIIVYEPTGMDYSLILTSLVHLISEPTSRTYTGFLQLVEHEWVLAGHPFFTRSAKIFTPNSDGNAVSCVPTFLLFLNCVYEILMKNKHCFEFTNELLEHLHTHSFSSNFGTFLFDCSKERTEKQAHLKTISLWSHLNNPEIRSSFLNPLYEPRTQLNLEIEPKNYVFWHELFLRSTRDPASNYVKQSFALLREMHNT